MFKHFPRAGRFDLHDESADRPEGHGLKHYETAAMTFIKV